MLPLARDGYTSEEVKEILHAPSRTENFRYRLLDKNEVEKGWLTTVTGGRVSYVSLSQIKRSATFAMTEDDDVDYLNDRIQVFVDISAFGKIISFPMGIFLLNSPKRIDNNHVVTREIEAYDKLQILAEDNFENRYYIPSGENYVNAISSVIMSAGETAISITPSANVTQTAKEFEIGMSKLDIINKLLDELNYTSLRCDVEGNFVADPYVEPAAKDVEYEYITNDESVIYGGAAEDIDLYNVKNVFVAYVDNPERAAMRSVFANENPASPTSTISRGRRLVDIRQLDDAADQAALDSYIRRIAINASNIYSHVNFNTAIMPMHDYLDTLRLIYTPLGISDVYQETSWELPLAVGASMRHTVRKVVAL